MIDRPQQPDPVEVVRARIRRAGQVLLLKRADGGSLTGRFETPGGKVDAGENHRQALARELHEETGLRLEGEPVLVGVREIVSPSGREVTEFSYEVSAAGRVTLSHEHHGHRWHRLGAPLPGPLTGSAVAALA